MCIFMKKTDERLKAFRKAAFLILSLTQGQPLINPFAFYVYLWYNGNGKKAFPKKCL